MPASPSTSTAARRLADLSAELDLARAEASDAEHTRVRPPASPPAPVPGPLPVVLPPGRHASRRPRLPVLPESLRGRIGFAPSTVAVLAVLVAAGLAVTAWWVLHSRPAELPPVAAVSSAPAGAALVTPVGVSSSPGSVATSPAAGGEVVVDVAGKVRRPGIVVLEPGSRVVDALEAAGGARRGVDLSALNLARPLVDGEQILVGLPAPAGVAASAAPSGAAPAGGLVSLNTATTTQLEELPEVGPVTAQAIVDWRTEHGAFTSVDELLEVDGIGEATLEQVAPYVTL